MDRQTLTRAEYLALTESQLRDLLADEYEGTPGVQPEGIEDPEDDRAA